MTDSSQKSSLRLKKKYPLNLSDTPPDARQLAEARTGLD